MYAYPMSSAQPRNRPKPNAPLWAIAIADRRKALGFRQSDIEAESGWVVKQSSVSDMERGEYPPTAMTSERLNAYLKALRWTPQQFTDATGLEFPGIDKGFNSAPPSAANVSKVAANAPAEPDILPPNAIPLGDIVSIRFLGDVAGGLFASGESTDEIRYFDVPRMFVGSYDPEDIYCLSVTGHSMASPDAKRNIAEGSLVLVHTKLERQNNRVVVCYLLEEALGVIKTWQESQEGVWLTSYNPDQQLYKPIAINKDTRAKFCGVVIGSYNPMITPNGRPLF